jgi:hypothetical protein
VATVPITLRQVRINVHVVPVGHTLITTNVVEPLAMQRQSLTSKTLSAVNAHRMSTSINSTLCARNAQLIALHVNKSKQGKELYASLAVSQTSLLIKMSSYVVQNARTQPMCLIGICIDVCLVQRGLYSTKPQGNVRNALTIAQIARYPLLQVI